MLYKLGFYGAGSVNGLGNRWFQRMAVNAGVNSLYVHNDGNTAMWDFLRAVDRNNDMIISQAEADAVDLRVCGYSWGSISAIGFTQKLSNAPVYIVVGGTPSQPIQYRLDAVIRPTILLTIDPVEWLNPAGTVPSTVLRYLNYYQQRGGYSLFRRVSDGAVASIGNSFSAALTGNSIASQAGITTQVRVDIGNWGTRSGTAFDILQPPDTANYSLNALETNHDGMPWLVGSVCTDALQ